MQFYKKRDFGTLISDTFNFFKIYGKNYFKNYLLLNGILIILMVFVFAFGYKELLMQLIGSNLDGQSYYFEHYFQENGVLLFVILGFVFLLFAILTILVYLYPIFYMKRVSEGQTTVTTDQILSDFKANIGKIFIFIICSVFIVYPLAAILFGIASLLLFIIIGFFLMLLLMPVVMNVMFFIMFDYFNTTRGFFESLSYAIRAQFSYLSGREKSPFWKYWSSIFVTYLMLMIIIGIFSSIPGILMLIYTFAVPQNGELSDPSQISAGMGIAMAVIYGVTLLVSFFTNNLLFVNAGLMYYDSRTDLHKKDKMSEIDSIGLHD